MQNRVDHFLIVELVEVTIRLFWSILEEQVSAVCIRLGGAFFQALKSWYARLNDVQ